MKPLFALLALLTRTSPVRGLRLLVVFLAMGAQAHALESLDDGSLADVNGAGIALAFDDFSSRFAPTSYIGVIGTAVTNPSVPYNTPYNWRRGDLYYYGLSMTGGSVTQGMDWAGTGSAGGGCTPGSDGLGCPIGRKSGSTEVEGIKNWASIYNPYMIRVFQYAGYSYEGTCLGTEVSGQCNKVLLSGATASPTYYEFIGPSNGDTWRWAFWGELLVNNGTIADLKQVGTNAANFSGNCFDTNVTGTCGGILKSQTIILGNNFTLDKKPTRLQIVQTPTTTVSEQSLSVIYQSRLSGNFRFSVAQTSSTTDDPLHGKVPDFNDTEGLYFKNVDAFLVLGQNNYQTVVFRNNGTTGNFIVELTPIANVANVSNTFYCGQNTCAAYLTSTIDAAKGGVGLNGSDPNVGCVNQSGTVVACSGITLRNIGTGAAASACATSWTSACNTAETIIDPANANPDSHGYVYWGTPAETRSGVTGVTAPTSADSTNGIYFRDSATGAVTNIGRAKVTGMMIQLMKITSLGVGT